MATYWGKIQGRKSVPGVYVVRGAFGETVRVKITRFHCIFISCGCVSGVAERKRKWCWEAQHSGPAAAAWSQRSSLPARHQCWEGDCLSSQSGSQSTITSYALRLTYQTDKRVWQCQVKSSYCKLLLIPFESQVGSVVPRFNLSTCNIDKFF